MKLIPTPLLPLGLVALGLVLCPLASADDKMTSGDNSALNTNSASTSSGTSTPASVTPMDQSNASADLKTTQMIRQALVGDKNLSVDAQNVKVITTQDHVVYLEGAVASHAEKRAVMKLAKENAGGAMVHNQLTIAGKPASSTTSSSN